MLQPLFDRILVEMETQVSETSSGLAIPESAQRASRTARVRSVGEGLISKNGSLRALAVHEGDRVFLAPFAGTDVEVAGEKFKLIRESDILGIFE